MKISKHIVTWEAIFPKFWQSHFLGSAVASCYCICCCVHVFIAQLSPRGLAQGSAELSSPATFIEFLVCSFLWKVLCYYQAWGLRSPSQQKETNSLDKWSTLPLRVCICLPCVHTSPSRQMMVSLPSCHLSPVNNVALMVHKVLRSCGLHLWFLIRAGSIPSSLKNTVGFTGKRGREKSRYSQRLQEMYVLCTWLKGVESLCVLGLLYYQ